MDTLELSIARVVRRASRRLAAGMLCLGAGACAGLEPSDELGGDVDRLAERLVQTARERADLRQIRVWVAEIHETRPETTRASMRDAPDDMIGMRLEHELVIALATRLNVVESEIVEPALATPARATLGESAAARGATHVLVGDYVRQRDALQITVRLVDAESRLIVAAARGAVKLAEVGLLGFDRWARSDGERGSIAVSGAAPGTTVTQPSRGAEHGEAASGAVTASLDAPEAPPPPPPVAATLPPPPAVITSSTAPTGSVEDFESWRRRRQTEQELAASQTVAALDQAARASTAAAVRARRDELANRPEEGAQPFPWRRTPWLARLLGIPQTPESGRH